MIKSRAYSLSFYLLEGTRAGNELRTGSESRIGNRRARQLALPLCRFGRFSKGLIMRYCDFWISSANKWIDPFCRRVAEITRSAEDVRLLTADGAFALFDYLPEIFGVG